MIIVEKESTEALARVIFVPEMIVLDLMSKHFLGNAKKGVDSNTCFVNMKGQRLSSKKQNLVQDMLVVALKEFSVKHNTPSSDEAQEGYIIRDHKIDFRKDFEIKVRNFTYNKVPHRGIFEGSFSISFFVVEGKKNILNALSRYKDIPNSVNKFFKKPAPRKVAFIATHIHICPKY